MSRENLMGLREEIDEIDQGVFELILKRVEAACKISELKRREGIESSDPKREQDIIIRKRAMARQYGLSEELIEAIFRAIIEIGMGKTLDKK